jgi:hypothetical protein
MTNTGKATVKIINLRGAFLDFKNMAMYGYARSVNADTEICFYLGMMCGVNNEEIEQLMSYLLEYWNAYVMDIVDGRYKYVKLTEIVYSSWLEYKAKRG